jgi:hypothetical protein
MSRLRDASSTQLLASAAGVRSGSGHGPFATSSPKESAQDNNAKDRRDENPRKTETDRLEDKAAELDVAFDPEKNAPEQELRNADAESANVSLPLLMQSTRLC